MMQSLGDMQGQQIPMVLILYKIAKSQDLKLKRVSALVWILTKGFIKAKTVGACVAGSSSRLMQMAGMRLPIESHVLQAFVSEGLKPLLPGVITFGAGHFYCSQSDKGGLYLVAISMGTTPMLREEIYQ